MIGRGDQNGIQTFFLEHFAMVAEALGIGRFLLGAVDVFGVDIAERGYMDVGILLEARHDICAAIAGSDYTQLNCVIRPQDSGIGCGGQRGGAAPQETAPGKLVIIHVRIIALKRTIPV